MNLALRFRQYRTLSSSENQSTMPKLVYIPNEIKDPQIQKIEKVRRERRFPSVCYLHEPEGCALFRSAEPSVLLNLQPCADDFEYLTLISCVYRKDD